MPNAYLGILAIFGIIVQMIGSGWMLGITRWLAGVGVPLILLGFLYRFRMAGAGDLKLFSVLGGYLDFSRIFTLITYAFFLGAIWSLIHLFYYHQFQIRFRYFKQYLTDVLKERKITPYYSIKNSQQNCTIPFASVIAITAIVIIII